MTPERRRRRRVTRAALWGLAAFHVADTIRLRRRRQQLVALPTPTPKATGRAAGSAGSAGPVDDPGAEVVTVAVAGAEVDRQTLAAVVAEMDASGAEVVDLVPGDLPVERALELLRRIDQERLGDDPLHAPGGAHEVVVLRRALADRMAGGGDDRLLDRRQMVRRTVDAQRHARGAPVLRVAPGLRATELTPRQRWHEVEELTAGLRPFVNPAPGIVGLDTLWLLLMTGGLVVAPGPALAALATWSAQPALVLGPGGPGRERAEAAEAAEAADAAGAALRPPGLLGASLMRLPRMWAANLRTIVAGFREGQADRARRAEVPVPAPPPPEELFEPRRDTCSWCGSPSLAGRVDVPDFFQHKPGTFHLDECRDCGHVFQNPRLSLAGLDYYYDQFYDGVTGEAAEVVFAQTTTEYQKRLDAIAALIEPQAWLDVGTGHGHFCVAARQRWPEATFDGLDISDSIETAERRGWVDRGYRGLFPDLAGGMPRSYDVVSMTHYLEHTREPRQELTAAAKVLTPGGHLMIDVPDPEAPWARRLGRYWIPNFQPQHQQLIPCGNLVAALDEAGFDTVSIERGPASMPAELSAAVFFGIQRLSRSPHMPWLPVPSAAERAWRMAVLLGSVPFFLAARVVEGVRDARLGPDDVGNAYRIIARRR